MTVTFDKAYGTLPFPFKKGYAFVRWFTDDNETITDETVVHITKDHILHAQWNEITTSHIEIVFATKDLTDEDIEEIVKKYTNAEFTISKVEDTETGELRVVIKFVDIEKAEEFVKSVKEASDSTRETLIKGVDFNSEAIKESTALRFSPLISIISFVF